jgi:hypothetical protein
MLIRIFAEIDLPLPKPGGFSHGTIKDVSIILGSIALLTLVLFLCVAYYKQLKRRGSGRRKSSSSEGPDLGKKVEKVVDSEGHRKLKVRKRRRGHRPRNPTLAETGGLPPPREQPPSA